ncbi:MAG TPA: hypothetical protein VNU72_07450 [Puia sp.]|jgi:hypothetical protein|nr:hypothetical protein [Puia sp.]
MKTCILVYMVAAMSLHSLPAFSQSKQDTTSLGLAGDNLDLYGVMDLFLKSKTIEGFEKSLNEQKSGLNNLDLDLDKKVDFIKVVTKKEGESYTFVLQVAVSEKETQDVAVILVNRDKNKKVNVQIVGDEDLYGKDYVIEPKPSGSPAVTANPAYTGPEPAKDAPATTTVVVQSAPIVQYVYSPAYVPYYPPYAYGFYPPYFAAFTVMAVGIYRHNNYYHHGGYYGGHYGGGNTVVINNKNQINHYNNSRNTSNRVQHNTANGNYGNRAGTRPSNGASAGTRPSNGAAGGGRPSAGTRPANGPSASTRPSTGPSVSTRQSGSNYSAPRTSSMESGRTRSGGGGGYGGGGSRGGGGGARGGGGGRRR